MKLSLDALKERAEAIATEELLGLITGGLEEALVECHEGSCAQPRPNPLPVVICDAI